MKKTDFSNVEVATKRLARVKADTLFPGLLSDAQMEEIQNLRIKKKSKGLISGRITEVSMKDFIIPGGGLDDEGREVDDFDITRYMQELEDPDTGVLHDLKIDTRQLPHADNYFDYAFRLIGKKANPPWARQLWTGLMLFGEICPCCSNPKWLDVHNVPKDYDGSQIQEHLTLLKKGKCPKCKRTKYQLIKEYGLKNYVQLVNVLGQRSGKSSSLAGYAEYHTHLLLMFPQYAALTNSMQASTQLTGTFVSLNFSKAVGVMWTPYRKRIMEESNWFKDYFKLMDHYKEKYGKELYRTSTLYLEFYLKNLRMYPSGPRSTTLRGDTRVLAALDELGLFPLPKGDDEEDENSERANADEAHKSLYNSLLTVNTAFNTLLKEGFQTVPPALLYCVSSPISLRDKVMRLLRDSEKDPSILGINLPTWEVNPYLEKDSPYIASAYIANAEKAERDFGANPPAVHSRFIGTDLITTKLFCNGQNSHTFQYQYDRVGEIYLKLKQVRTFNYPTVVSIDAGHTNNSFSIAAGYYDFEIGDTVVTTLLECMPVQKRKINFTLLYTHVILQLCKDLNAVALVADQWQGLDQLYRVKEDMGLNPLQKPRTKGEQYSPKRKDFDMVLHLIKEGTLKLPSLKSADIEHVIDGQIENYRTEMFEKPVQHLALQMATVRDIGTLRAPDKGENMTDDLFRAKSLLVTAIHRPKIMERLSEARKFIYGGNRSVMPRPVFVSRSGWRR